MVTKQEQLEWLAKTWESYNYAPPLKRGLVHATKEADVAHAKALLGIDPNE